jgi:hypothetical protein
MMERGKQGFINACMAYRARLQRELIWIIGYAMEHPGRCEYEIHPDAITADCEGYKYLTLVYGFWNREARRYDSSVFADYGIRNPLDEFLDKMDPAYKIRVSEASRHDDLRLWISWTPDTRHNSSYTPQTVREVQSWAEDIIKTAEQEIQEYPRSDPDYSGFVGRQMKMIEYYKKYSRELMEQERERPRMERYYARQDTNEPELDVAFSKMKVK